MLNRWIAFAACAWAAAVLPLMASAQTGSAAAPQLRGPITLVVSSTAGGGADVAARQVGQAMSETLGQPVIVENRPGASGTIAGLYVVRAPADGRTLLFTPSSIVQSAAQSQRPPYSLSDLVGVSRIGLTNLILIANPELVKVDTLDTLLAEIKARPGHYSYGSYGNGTSAHIYGEILKRSAGLSMTHVAYKGVAPMVNDVVSGQIALAFADIGTSMPLLATKRLKVLAITGVERFPGLPDTPTFKERGVPGLELTGWYGLLAPAKTDPAIVARLAQSVDAAIRQPALRQGLLDRGISPAGGSAAQFDRELRVEEAEWTRRIQENNIRGD